MFQREFMLEQLEERIVLDGAVADVQEVQDQASDANSVDNLGWVYVNDGWWYNDNGEGWWYNQNTQWWWNQNSGWWFQASNGWDLWSRGPYDYFAQSQSTGQWLYSNAMGDGNWVSAFEWVGCTTQSYTEYSYVYHATDYSYYGNNGIAVAVSHQTLWGQGNEYVQIYMYANEFYGFYGPDDSFARSIVGDRMTITYGTSGNDYIDTCDNGRGSIILGGDGNDYIVNGPGSDWLFGNAGDDYIFTSQGNDFLDGGEGNDYFDVANTSNLTIVGGYGDDYIDLWPVDAGSATYVCHGGPGNDTFVLESFQNVYFRCYGGSGADAIDLWWAYGGYSWNQDGDEWPNQYPGLFPWLQPGQTGWEYYKWPH